MSMMRSQQAIAVGNSQGYLPPEHYDQIFSAHGTIMIFFVAMPLVIGVFSRASWWGYPPLSELAYSPDVGVDYYL